MSTDDGEPGAVGAGWTTTQEPGVLDSSADEVFGIPVWAFGSLVGVIFVLACVTPLLLWLKRMSNLSKPYVPSERPNVDGFVDEVLGKAEASGDLQRSRIGRS
mmetsp:Transcript_102210/g.256267  ORF Transcript_102210/g.256267 Transcript_102210/m.256267 type:complete len:103 (+) Transcript_102210:38-346(+)